MQMAEDILNNVDLAAAAQERERNRVPFALARFLKSLPDRSSEIEHLFGIHSPGKATTMARILVSNEIVASVEGAMIVPEYNQKVAAHQCVYVFVGTHWETIVQQQYFDFIIDACRKIGLDESILGDQKEMCKIFERVAFKLSRHIATVDPLDAVWVNCRNCTVEIGVDGSVKTHEHQASDFFTYCLQYEYDPQAECPKWRKFLDEVMPDKGTQDLLGEYIGYCFSKNLKLEKMAVFYGTGANGKSVLLDVIKALYGSVNVSEATLSSITTDDEARTVLENKLVNISSESGKNLDNAILKKLVSGEPVQMRKLYVGTKMLMNPPKLFTSYNELPPMEHTHGYRRRWLLFPFKVTIPEEKQDYNLASKLCLELPGILNWVLGCLGRLIQRVKQGTGCAFTESTLCREAMIEYSRNSNSSLLFLHECCEISEDSVIKFAELYSKYLEYCGKSGISKPAIKKNFTEHFKNWGGKIVIKHNVKYACVQITNFDF